MPFERKGVYEADVGAVQDLTKRLEGQANEFDKLVNDFCKVPVQAGVPQIGQPMAAAAAQAVEMFQLAQQALRRFFELTTENVQSTMKAYDEVNQLGQGSIAATTDGIGGAAPLAPAQSTPAALATTMQAAGYSHEQIYQEFGKLPVQMHAGMAPIYSGDLASARPQEGDVYTWPDGTFTVGADRRAPDGIPPGTQGTVYRQMTAAPFGQNA